MSTVWQYIEAFGTIVFYLLKLGVQRLDAATKPARELVQRIWAVLYVLATLFVAGPAILVILGLVIGRADLFAIASLIAALGFFILNHFAERFGELFLALEFQTGGITRRAANVGMMMVKALQSYALSIVGLTLFFLVLMADVTPTIIIVALAASMIGLTVVAKRVRLLGVVFRTAIYAFILIIFLVCTGFLLTQAIKRAKNNPQSVIGQVIKAVDDAARAKVVKDSLTQVERVEATRRQARHDSLDRVDRQRAARLADEREITRRKQPVRVVQPVRTVVREVTVSTSVQPSLSSTPLDRYTAEYLPVPPDRAPQLEQQGRDGGWFRIESAAIMSASQRESRFRFSTPCPVNWDQTYVVYDLRRYTVNRDGEFVLPNLMDGQVHELFIHLACFDRAGDQVSVFTFTVKNNKSSG